MQKDFCSNNIDKLLKYEQYLNENNFEPNSTHAFIKNMIATILHYEEFLNHYGQEVDTMLVRVNQLKNELTQLAINMGNIEIVKKLSNLKVENIRTWQI